MIHIRTLHLPKNFVQGQKKTSLLYTIKELVTTTIVVS
jgi:hypothetical protein